jgi:O-Antigen ligase
MVAGRATHACVSAPHPSNGRDKLKAMAARTRLEAIDRSRLSTLFVVLASVVLATFAGLITAKLGNLQHELKALLIVMAAIAMVVAALRPEIGLVILIALAPFELHFYGTGSDELLLVGLSLVLVWRIRASAIPAWVAVGGFSLVVGSFVAALGAASKTTALWGGVRWLSAIVVLFAALSILRNQRDASRRMVDIFTGSAVVVVVFAFAQKAGIHVIVGAPYISGHPSSFFGYYTNYAGYGAMAAVLATGEVLAALLAHKTARATTYGAALVFILIGIAISVSRGGLLALGGGWLMLLVLNVRRGSVLAQTVVILVIFVAAGYLATPRSTVVAIQQRFATPLGSRGGDKERFALQQAGEQALERYPTGLGFGNFANYLRSHVRNIQIRQEFAHAQNTPVQVGLDAGWLGLAGFLLLFAWPIGLVLKHSKGGPSTVRASAFAAALCGFMAQGLYDYLFFEVAFLIFFVAMVWGTIHALSVDEREASTVQRAVSLLGSTAPLRLRSRR